jgi:hypothetical protein
MNGVAYMQIGEWVKKRGTSRVGVIVKHDATDKQFFVKWHWEKGEPILHNAVGWVDEIALVGAELELKDADYKAMIDLALDTNDFKWFNLLRRKAGLTKLSTN